MQFPSQMCQITNDKCIMKSVVINGALKKKQTGELSRKETINKHFTDCLYQHKTNYINQAARFC